MRSNPLFLPSGFPDIKKAGKNVFYSLYKKEIEEIAFKLANGADAPRLLLHSCCGPCSSAAISRLAHLFRITIFYYNPNIDSAAEYERRADTQRKLLASFNGADAQRRIFPVDYMEESYNAEPFCKATLGFEAEREGGKRCEVCFKLRLEKAAEKAHELSAGFFCTTLTVSPMKNAQTINRLGFEAGRTFGAKWLWSDFKKEGGYALSVLLSKELGLYRQNYCGCAFSKREKANETKLVELARLH